MGIFQWFNKGVLPFPPDCTAVSGAKKAAFSCPDNNVMRIQLVFAKKTERSHFGFASSGVMSEMHFYKSALWIVPD